MGDNFPEGSKPEAAPDMNGALADPYASGTVVYDRVGNRKGIVVCMKGWQAPPNAYVMSPNEIEQHVKSKVNEWDTNKLHWMTYGKMINIAATSFTSTVLVSFFRRKFNIRGFKGFAMLVVPGIMAPIGISAMTSGIIESKIERVPVCQTCVETQGGGFQVAVCGFYPGFLVPLLCVYYSKQSFSYETAKPRFYPSMLYAYRLKPLQVLAGLGLLTANFASGFYVAHMQNNEINDYVTKEATEKGQYLLEKMGQKADQ